MSYKVTKGDGKTVIVQDLSKEIVGGLSLIGYGFANYGDEIAQNFVKDLENNAGSVEPQNPVLGQFWLEVPIDPTSDRVIYLCVNPEGSTLLNRWRPLFRITRPNNDVIPSS